MKITPWPQDRREELGKLQHLLNEVSTINRGNRCLERIQSCITLAEELNRSDLDSGRPSFMQYLVAHAAGGRCR